MDGRVKTLWMFQYHFGCEEVKKSTVMYLEFFYASDREEAEQLRDAFLASHSEPERVTPELLEPCEHGVMLLRKFLPGKKTIPD